MVTGGSPEPVATPAAGSTYRDKGKRRETPCQACRTRRVRCDAWERHPKSCTRCDRMALTCVTDIDEAATREDNATSEVRAQLQRLNAVIAALAEDEKHDEIDMDRVEHAPAQNDLVAQFTRLCFTDSDHRPPADEQLHQLLQRAKQVLRSEAELRDRMYGGDEQPPTMAPSTASLDELIDCLPDKAIVRDVLAYAMGPTAFCVSFDNIFSPRFYHGITTWANSEDRFPWGASRLAELLAFCASMFNDWDTTSRNSAWAGALPKSLKHVQIDFYIRAAMRALDLADYLDHPDLPGVRALYLIVAHMAIMAPTTDYIVEGLALGGVALALCEQMDLISEDDREGESTIDCYERRAVVSALLRVQWMLTPNALGRPALMPECMRESAPPSYLEASSLAPHLRNIPRGTREEMDMLRLRHSMARLSNDIATTLAIGNKVSIRVFRELHDQVSALVSQVPPKYGYHIDDEDRIVPNAQLLDARSLLLSKTLTDFTELTQVTMHRVALGLQSSGCNPAIVKLHSNELIKHARIVLFSTQRMAKAQMAHMAAIAFGFSSHVALAISSVLDLADENARTTYREEAREAIAVYDTPTMRFFLPPAIRKLTLICRFLLDQPRLRAAPAGEAPPAKRSRPSDPFGEHGRPTLKSPTSSTAEVERVRKTPVVPNITLTTTTSGTSSSRSIASASLYKTPPTDSPASPVTPDESQPLPADLFDGLKGTFDFVVPPAPTFNFGVPSTGAALNGGAPAWQTLMMGLIGDAPLESFDLGG